MGDQPMLKVNKLTKKFGNLIAVNHADFEVHRGGDCRIDRSKWRWKNNPLQCHQRPL